MGSAAQGKTLGTLSVIVVARVIVTDLADESFLLLQPTRPGVKGCVLVKARMLSFVSM